MNYKEAIIIAEKYKEVLKPYCLKCEIAGSLRRKKQIVKDIELVAVPKTVNKIQSFFDVERIRHPEFIKTVNNWEKVKGIPEGKYTQRILPEGIKLDLFMCELGNWGCTFLIRTGDWEFSKKFMGTIMPRNGYQQRNGWVQKNGEYISVLEEKDLFELMNIKYIEPQDRMVNCFRKERDEYSNIIPFCSS